MNQAPVILHLVASPRGARSHSRAVAREFLAAWQTRNPGGKIVERDLGQTPPPFVTEAWVEGAFTPPETHSAAAREAIAVSDVLVDELLAADEILLSTPIFNCSVPASAKAWIDQIVRAGRTFAVTEAGYAPLVSGKRLTVIAASGSDLRLDGPFGAYNILEPLLRASFGFIGITDQRYVYAHSLNASEAAREQALAEARDAVRDLAVAA